MKIEIDELRNITHNQKEKILLDLIPQIETGWMKRYLKNTDVKGRSYYSKVFCHPYNFNCRDKNFSGNRDDIYYLTEYQVEERKKFIRTILDTNNDIFIWIEAFSQHTTIDMVAIRVAALVQKHINSNITTINIHVIHEYPPPIDNIL